MALSQDLTGLGLPPALADYLGVEIQLQLAGVGTSQSGAAAITKRVTTVTTSSGQTAAVLPSSAPLGSVWEVYNESSTAALLFPPSGGAIDGGSADASVNIAQNKGRAVRRLSSTVWRTVYSA